MSNVIEYEATREQVLDFTADCDRVMSSFDESRAQAVPSQDTRALVHWIREKWDAQRQSRGRRMSSGGLYGSLAEAILRLPRLTRPKTWYSDLYDARETAPFIKQE